MLESIKVKKKESIKLGSDQTSLLTGRTARPDRKLEYCRKQIELLQFQHQIIESIVEGRNERGVILTALDLERCGDQKLSLAWGWLLFDLDKLEVYEGAPNADDYTWGNYSHHSKDVEKYVRDRAKWYLPFVKEELQTTEARLKELKERLW